MKHCNEVVRLYSAAYEPDKQEFLLIEGSIDKMVEALSKADWAHVEKLDISKEEDREKLREMGVDVDKEYEEYKERRGVEQSIEGSESDNEDNKEEKKDGREG